MNFRSRAIGIITGTALTLSIASGAMAQQQQTSTNTANVELQDDQDGQCYISLSGEYELGVWKWNGAQYVQVGSSANYLEATISQDISSSPVDCDVNANQQSALTIDGLGTGPSIPMSFSWSGEPAGPSATVETATGSTTKKNVIVTMSNLTNQPAGTYEGSVTVTSEASAG